VQLKRKLHIARRIGLSADNPESTAVQIRIRIREHGPVQQIERLGPKLLDVQRSATKGDEKHSAIPIGQVV
jgi:hypothetical protein